MENLQSAVDTLIHGANTLFILMGAIMVLAMHAGFAFLEVGTVRQKNQVNALSKIISDFAVSCLAYFSLATGSPTARISLPAQSSLPKTTVTHWSILLPDDLCGGDPGDHLRRYC